MKKLLLPLLLLAILFGSCSKEDDVVEPTPEEVNQQERRNLEVEEFIFGAMNEIYLYEADVPQLQDGYFSSQDDFLDFLEGYNDPVNLYYDLVADHDQFSFMTEDYVALNKLLNEGISGTTGMNYRLHTFGNNTDVFGYVRYVIPGSPAEEAGVKRGDFFTEIDGSSLNVNNYQQLLGQASFSMRIDELINDTITHTDKVVELSKVEIAEDPIFTHNVFEIEGENIGYLLYNGFTPDFDAQLNSVFGEFKSRNISSLILDLRYNGGGNVETAIDLSSMITGQFNEQIILKYEYNQYYQTYFEQNRPEDLLMYFNNSIRNGESINSLNLTKVYVITTRSSASASELVIHALEPYIDVVQIGGTTRGKFQASATLYDSPNLSYTNKDGEVHVNPNHNYALQPLIVKYANKDDESDFVDGLFPDVEASEDLGNLGTLGDPNETLLNAAINTVLGKAPEPASAMQKRVEQEFKFIWESDMFKPNYQRVYLDKIHLPEVIPAELN